MSGKGGRIPYRGGYGNGNRVGRGKIRGHNYCGTIREANRGLCNALGTGVFDYCQKLAEYQIRSSWEKLVQYVGTNYGQDISNKLQNKIIVNLVEPVHALDVIARHAIGEWMIRTGQANIHTARSNQRTILQAAVTAFIDDTAPMKLAVLENEIAQSHYEANVDVPVIMTDLEKTHSSYEWCTCRERKKQLTKHRGQGFSLIFGQLTQLLQDKMNQDTEWNVVSTSYDPLTLYRMIEKTVLGQTKDQYPFVTVYNQELGFYAFRQYTMSHPQWY